MKFRLLVAGPLRPAGKAKAQEKQKIRRELHPQLRLLWKEHATLKRAWKENSEGIIPVERIADEFQRCGFRWVPLVTKDNELSCSLNVLILRRVNPFNSMHGSDLDNQVKTLIDGLRLPDRGSEVAGDKPAGCGDDPFFCLLEDDRSIHNVSVVTDRLLLPKQECEPDNECVAVVQVDIKTREGFEIAVISKGFW